MPDATHISFSLPASITMENVEALTAEMRALALQPESLLTLDASATDIITTPGIQLLLSLHMTVAQHSGKLAVNNARPTFAQSFETLGLQAQLAAWSEQHA